MAIRVSEFAKLLTQRRGTDLDTWVTDVRSDDLPALHAFADGLDKDYDAVVAGLTLPYSNGATEGVVNKIKMLNVKPTAKPVFPCYARESSSWTDPDLGLIAEPWTEPLDRHSPPRRCASGWSPV